MRGGEQSCLVTGSAKDGCYHSRRGTFAVGPGQMNSRVGMLRRTDILEKLRDVLKPQLHAEEFPREDESFG